MFLYPEKLFLLNFHPDRINDVEDITIKALKSSRQEFIMPGSEDRVDLLGVRANISGPHASLHT